MLLWSVHTNIIVCGVSRAELLNVDCLFENSSSQIIQKVWPLPSLFLNFKDSRFTFLLSFVCLLASWVLTFPRSREKITYWSPTFFVILLLTISNTPRSVIDNKLFSLDLLTCEFVKMDTPSLLSSSARVPNYSSTPNGYHGNTHKIGPSAGERCLLAIGRTSLLGTNCSNLLYIPDSPMTSCCEQLCKSDCIYSDCTKNPKTVESHEHVDRNTVLPYSNTVHVVNAESPKKRAKLLAADKAAFFDLNNPEMFNNKLSDCLETWRQELKDDPEATYLLKGVECGFDVLEGKQPDFKACSDNYKSATITCKSKVEKQIKTEISCGNYIKAHTKPQVVSSIGAIEKSNGAVRLIHDLSRPDGGVNAYVEDSSVHYNTIDYATSLMSPGCYVSKIDLKSAYRSIPISPKNYKYMGLSWLFAEDNRKSFLIDTKLPFGSRKACQVFTAVSDAITRILRKKNVIVVNYLDDFLIISNSKTENWLELNTAVNLMVSLGLDINWDKLSPPSQNLTFLGVRIDTNSRILSLPSDKLTEVKDLINSWLVKKRASKRQLQKLLGKLNWCCRVILGGRTFMRRIIDCSMKLREANHRTWLGAEIKKDLIWWSKALDVFHGFTPFVCDMKPPSYELSTDACRTAGAGVFINDWFFCDFKSDFPNFSDEHINCLELLTILLAARRWAHLWSGYHIKVNCDNQSAVFAINKGSSRSKLFMSVLRELFWLSVKNNFRLTASYIEGSLNTVADMLSRLHDVTMRCKFVNMFGGLGSLNVANNMSYTSYLSLQGIPV